MSVPVKRDAASLRVYFRALHERSDVAMSAYMQATRYTPEWRRLTDRFDRLARLSSAVCQRMLAAEAELAEVEAEVPEPSPAPVQSVYDWPFARYYWEVQRLLLWEDYAGVAALAVARATKPEVAA